MTAKDSETTCGFGTTDGAASTTAGGHDLNTAARPVPRWRCWVHSMLGTSVAGQATFADAKPLLVSSYGGLTERIAAIPNENRSVLVQTGQWIVQLYQSLGRSDKVNEWQQRLGAR